MPDWAGVLEQPQREPVYPRNLQDFVSQRTISAAMHAAIFPAAKHNMLAEMRAEVAVEMFRWNCEPVGDEVLEWERVDEFDAWVYRLSQQGMPR
jgi:hypothetical protein